VLALRATSALRAAATAAAAAAAQHCARQRRNDQRDERVARLPALPAVAAGVAGVAAAALVRPLMRQQLVAEVRRAGHRRPPIRRAAEGGELGELARRALAPLPLVLRRG
jgi:hypothetical protein